jgi:hypothetical protein
MLNGKDILILKVKTFLVLITIMYINKEIDEVTYKSMIEVKKDFLRKCG